MAKYCVYCGKPLKADGRCPNCSADPGGASGKKPKKKRRTLMIVLITASALLLAALIPLILILCGVIRNPFAKYEANVTNYANDVEQKETFDVNIVERKETPPEYVIADRVERPDAQEALEEIGTIVSRMQLRESDAMQTEAEAWRDLTERGFAKAPITTSYAADGTYTQEKEILSLSNETHPTYQTIYVSGSGVIWSILSVNGKIVANPLSLNSGDHWDTMHLLSETGTFMEYDSATKTFFEIVPDPSEVHIRTIARIDAETLDAMTAAEVDG